MKRYLPGILVVLSLVIAGLSANTTSSLHRASAHDGSTATSLRQTTQTYEHACSTAPPGYASCFALIAKQSIAAPQSRGLLHPLASAPNGNPPYTPANLHAAYNLPTTSASTQTVAIIDANDDPNAESDLAQYRAQFGLPPCTTANGCFRKVDEQGGSNYPAGDTGWGEEISLDLDMVSAICYNCHILLVEATTASFTDLGASVNTAVQLGATEISNSYGSNGEDSGESMTCATYYTHPGIAITASSGDGGLEVSEPAVCANVVSVGGTTLNSDGSETLWNNGSSGAGGGCSQYISKPAWENTTVSGCAQRTVSDVSAVADPNTGVDVYDSYGAGGWMQIGGTSASSPIIAAVYALAGGTANATDAASIPWNNTTSGCLNQVPTGTAYSYQGGLGTPDGLACF